MNTIIITVILKLGLYVEIKKVHKIYLNMVHNGVGAKLLPR